MVDFKTKLLSVSFESFFKVPVVWRELRPEEVAKKCLDAYSGYGLKSNQIAQRIGDALYNYDLSFPLFNGVGTFKISSEKLEMQFQNLISDKDSEIVADCVVRMCETVTLPEVAFTTISASAHSLAESVDVLHSYLAKYSDPQKQIVLGGAIAYLRCQSWPEEIRLLVDRSLMFNEGLFLNWITNANKGKLDHKDLKSLTEVFTEAAGKLGIKFVGGEQ